MAFHIIDSHFHMGQFPEQTHIDRSLESLLDFMDRHEIGRGISANNYMFVNDQLERALEEDAVIFEKSNHRIYTYFGYHPKYIQRSLSLIRAHKDDPQCVAIKINPKQHEVMGSDESFRPCWEIARELNIPIMAHTWDTSTYNIRQKYSFTGVFEKWLAEYPDVNFVFAHSGGRYNGIKTAIDLGRKYPNAHFDMAGDIWPLGYLETMVENLGTDRIFYASDYSMIGQLPMLGVVYGSSLTAAQKEQILGRNAARVFFKEE